MSKENKTMLSIYKGYISERDIHVKNSWIRLISYVKRITGNKKEFYSLLSSETVFHKNMYSWVKGHIQNNKLEYEEVKNISTSLKLFTQELHGRNLFLILFVVLLGLSMGFSEFLDTYIGKEKDPYIIMILSFFALLAVIERGHVINHHSYSSQLSIFLELWLDEHKKEPINELSSPTKSVAPDRKTVAATY